MEWFEALILGLVQGLTEFLPVSSSGHLEIGRSILGVNTTDDLMFTTMVHAATVLSTVLVFRKQIWGLLKGFLKFKYNDETDYVFKIALSCVPIMIVGLFARLKLKVNYYTLMGLLSGSMTNPPALGYSNATSGNDMPALGYATVYPVVMFLRVLMAQMLILMVM
jgi:undecaprenyl pyrophosphate phosphatase UppP